MSTTNEKKELLLRVAEAKQKDVGRGKVRIDLEMLKEIGVEPGDVVEIEGRRKTAAIAWPNYTEDQGQDIIRMDGLVRKNAGVSIGDKVIVRKAQTKPATYVKLAPNNYNIEVENSFVNYIKRRLIDTPVVEGDTVLIPVLGQPIPFSVIQTKPIGIVIITNETNLIVLDKPVDTGKMPRVTYEDIGGLKPIVERIRELVELPLKYPEVFKRLGIEPPKGVLLYGAPGTGKTLLAKAVANETQAYFVAINGPEIMSKFYGESEQRLREIFEEAKKHTPAIIFIDEIDAIAPKRDEVIGEVERRVVAQLLALMDGLETRGDVIVIAATNRPNAIDPALRRPGRFDREIEIPLPDRQGRLEILQIHTRNMPLAEDVDLEKIASITHGYTGADLAALSREAAMHALRRYLPKIDLNSERIPEEVLNSMVVTMQDFMEAYKEIIPSGLREIYIEVPNVKWSDIGGLEEAKQQLREAVEWPLKYPESFKKIGIRPPRGVLLFGPPGTGKTMLAKAVATESEANFIAVRGPEVLSKWVGESEKAIREIFRRARQYSPVIIFFDEIDSLVPIRGMSSDSYVTERVVSQLLTEMDGIESLENVIVIAATNRPDIIDPALLRPGRLEKLIYIPPPDKDDRLEILKIHTKKMPLASDVDLERIAEITEGYTGADIEALVREAGLRALRENLSATEIRMRHFEDALQVIKPSITKQMIEYYIKWFEQARQAISKKIIETTPYI
ncbi:CDC48 family AAA ATPase [Fervidicoccus fontis]|uniref:AAA family ATPase-domain containing protein n=1 Tax=Fervidicoccus fontis (strain DSM 19380 / JCM 18336 / VKM B-2539 / Kam940) TaxID=1163730 RepID=I0A044_FERFK|nr:CDC48 family AAA ATPase [Fervidicoccus fontis]AFH42351.1 AAA family ATPase-domain containing protein [Fervidicoccus fontis Kam940]